MNTKRNTNDVIFQAPSPEAMARITSWIWIIAGFMAIYFLGQCSYTLGETARVLTEIEAGMRK